MMIPTIMVPIVIIKKVSNLVGVLFYDDSYHYGTYRHNKKGVILFGLDEIVAYSS